MTLPMAPRFPGGYVIRVKMRFDLAEAIFHAAGAQVSHRHVTPPPGTQSRCFLLPDNTMAYLAIDTSTTPPTVSKIATGLGGAGREAKWSWDNIMTKPLESLELQPNPVPRPRY
jgi:hypothetical protein